MKLLNLGTILKQKGLDGCVKVFSTTDFAETRYQKGNKVFLHNEESDKLIEVTVRDFYSSGQFDYVSFEEYQTFEAIAPFLQWKICIDKDNAPLEEGLYYICDLEGCDVIDARFGNIGKCIGVEEYTNRRSLRIKLNSKKEILVPDIDVFVKGVDIEKKIINVALIDGMVE